jgi:hypothetical protein
MIAMSSITVDVLIWEAHLSETQARLASDLSTVDITPDTVEEVVAADNSDNRKWLDAHGLGIEGFAAIAFVGRVVVTEDDESVNMRVEVIDAELLDRVFECGLRLTSRVVEAVALASVQPVTVDVDVRVAVRSVLEVDSTASIVLAVNGVGFALAGVVADGKGVGAVAVL